MVQKILVALVAVLPMAASFAPVVAPARLSSAVQVSFSINLLNSSVQILWRYIHMSSKAVFCSSVCFVRRFGYLSPSELTSSPSAVNVFHAPRRPPRAKYPSTNSMEVTFASESSKPDGMLNLSTSWLTDAKRLSKSATSRKKIFLRRVSPGRMSCPLQLDFWHSVEPLMPLSQQESWLRER